MLFKVWSLKKGVLTDQGLSGLLLSFQPLKKKHHCMNIMTLEKLKMCSGNNKHCSVIKTTIMFIVHDTWYCYWNSLPLNK